MTQSLITEDQREFANDMGYAVCEACASTYSPLLGWANDGHQCSEDGTVVKFMLPLTHKSLKELGYTNAERERAIVAWDQQMLDTHGITIERPHADD